MATVFVYSHFVCCERLMRLDGVTQRRTTVTVENVPFLSPEAKADHFYQLHRNKMDAKELIDLFIAEGANVFRLP